MLETLFTKLNQEGIIAYKFCILLLKGFVMSKKVIKEVISWILVFVIAIIAATLIKEYIIYNVEVPTGSMEHTIEIGDRVVTSRLSYLSSDPRRGDIVVFPFPDDEEMDYIKRIIGLPGETIEGKDGLVYIDGNPLEEPYVTEALDSDFGPYEVPEDSYFMMGDNRNNSQDSRYWENKFLAREKIEGKAILRYPKLHWFGSVDYKK
jgi:signal peptidase I